jgi:hypothetical protein
MPLNQSYSAVLGTYQSEIGTAWRAINSEQFGDTSGDLEQLIKTMKRM